MRRFAIFASTAALLAVLPLDAEFREVDITTLGMD
jgi:hypothetical protein